MHQVFDFQLPSTRDSAIHSTSAACYTNLYFPPPSSSVHVTIDPNCLVRISIVSFGFELEVRYKVMTAKKLLDAANNITAEEFMCLASMFHLPPFELWAVRW